MFRDQIVDVQVLCKFYRLRSYSKTLLPTKSEGTNLKKINKLIFTGNNYRSVKLHELPANAYVFDCSRPLKVIDFCTN